MDFKVELLRVPSEEDWMITKLCTLNTIGKTSTHHGHPWYNTSTDAGVLKVRLYAYDKKYRNLKQKSKYYREKEEKQKFRLNSCPSFHIFKT